MRQFNGEQIHALLDRLFDAALNAEEFEYCCTLLRVRGIMPATWDPLAESYAFTQQLTALINAPSREDLRLGLILLLYCHLTEMDDLYSVPMNLLRVIDGRRYSLAPFESGEGRPLRSPPLKAKRLAGLDDRLGFGELGDL